MALFESYERRIDQIKPVMEKYGIKDFEDALAICKEKGFIKSNTPVNRVLAVQNEEHFIMDIAFDATLYRPMPVYGIPQISANLLLQ